MKFPCGRLALVCAACSIFTASAMAQGSASEVRQFLEQRDLQIKAAIESLETEDSSESRERAAKLINERIDFAEMGRLALGPHFVDLSAADQERFVSTFAAIVRSQALSDLSVYRASVTFDSVRVTGPTAFVRTRANVSGTTLEVDYLLHRQEDDWWLYDIVIDGVGTVDGYSVSFRSYIRKRGFERFMQSLENRLSRLGQQP